MAFLTQLLNGGLPRPDALEAELWAAIEDPLERLKRAVSQDDRPLVIGSAKELVEATARVVLVAKGQVTPSEEDFGAALGEAHRQLVSQPGPGLAQDPAVNKAASNAKKTADLLRGLRNAYGVGHGRAAVPVIEDELLEACVASAILWTRWALRRLQLAIRGDLQRLIVDLRPGPRASSFYKGDLAERLQAADLGGLVPSDQRSLGVAVGQRTSSNTFTVRKDGVEACAASQNSIAWPPAYREGLVEGMMLDTAGHLHVDDECAVARLAAEVLGPHPGQSAAVTALKDKVIVAAWSPGLPRVWRKLVSELRMACNLLTDPDARDAWSKIADHVEQSGRSYESTL